MRDYCKPTILHLPFQAKEEMASLDQWLSNNNLTESGITTYVINS